MREPTRIAAAYLTLALAVGGIVSLSLFAGLFSGLEYFFEDLLFSPKPVHPDIVIIAIDDASLEKIGQWPWPRRIIADALTTLSAAPPRAVGIDILFSEPSRHGTTDDQTLSQAMTRAPYPIILPLEARFTVNQENPTRADTITNPLPIFLERSSTTLGHINVIEDRDGTVRRFPNAVTAPDGILYPSFAHTLLTAAGMRSDATADDNTPERIVFAGPPGTVRSVPFWRLKEKDPALNLAGKIVLIGVTAQSLHDTKKTPVSRGSEMPGVEVHAHIVNMLINRERLSTLSVPLMSALLIVLALIPALFFLFFKNSVVALAASAALALAFLVVTIISFEQGVVLNMVHGMLSIVLSASDSFGIRHRMAEKDRRRIRALFGRYVSPHVLAEILKNPKQVTLGGEEREITVLFSDIRGFTALSEKTEPQELVEILNRYFELMSREILATGGVLDKYIGDAVMAFWGAPLEDEAQADHAIQAAHGMVARLSEFNEMLRREGKPEIKIGIGIHTGLAIVGNIGASHHMNYTIIGDAVNTASRLESLNKEYKTSIIIGDTVKHKARGMYLFKPIGSVAIRGKGEPVTIYTIAEA